MAERTTIQIDKTTRVRLQTHGKMGDSFDGLINRLLDIIEGKESTDSNESHDKAPVTV